MNNLYSLCFHRRYLCSYNTGDRANYGVRAIFPFDDKKLYILHYECSNRWAFFVGCDCIHEEYGAISVDRAKEIFRSIVKKKPL